MFLATLGGTCTTALAQRASSADSPSYEEKPLIETQSGWLMVRRDENAKDCPDAAELRRATEVGLTALPPPDETQIIVDFVTETATLRVDIRRRGETGLRTLRDETRGCAALAQATASALLMMLDTQPEPMTPIPFPEEPLLPPPAPAAPAAPSRLSLTARGGAAYGLTAGWSPAFELDAEYTRSFVQLAVGGLYVLPQRVQLGPGSVQVDLLALAARTCVAPLLVEGSENETRTGLWACAGVSVGTLRASASGYSSNYAEDRPWLAFAGELAARRTLWKHGSFELDAQVAASLLVPPRQQSFSVAGLGEAAAAEPVGGLFWAGFSGVGLW